MKTPILAALAIVAVLSLAIWIEVQVWTDCRAYHSWLFCVRLVGR